MKPRALFLILCLAGLATVIWPSEVMSPTQEEIASNKDDSVAGELLDISSFEPDATKEPTEEVSPNATTEVVTFQEVAPAQGSLRGRDYGSLARQGEILAHQPMAMEAYLASTELHPGRERFLEACAHIALEQLEASEVLWQTVADGDPVSSVERSAIARLLGDGERGAAVPASSQGNNAVVLGLEMAYMQGELRAALRELNFPAACGLLSNLLELELTADWEAHVGALSSWAKQLNEAQGLYRWSEKGEWTSIEYEVQAGDSLVAVRKHVIAERPELNLCTGLIARANQLRDENTIYPGQKLRIPLDPVHTRVDLSARFMLYYHGDEVVCAWPVTIGREGKTKPGDYTVGQKKERPMWFPQGRPPVPFGEPENPLGTRWIAWDGSNGLGYHGTSEAEQIGKEASDGCIRLRNRDVEVLFEILPVGSPIVVQP